jgi:hypothetical protein
MLRRLGFVTLCFARYWTCIGGVFLLSREISIGNHLTIFWRVTMIFVNSTLSFETTARSNQSPFCWCLSPWICHCMTCEVAANELTSSKNMPGNGQCPVNITTNGAFRLCHASTTTLPKKQWRIGKPTRRPFLPTRTELLLRHWWTTHHLSTLPSWIVMALGAASLRGKPAVGGASKTATPSKSLEMERKPHGRRGGVGSIT